MTEPRVFDFPTKWHDKIVTNKFRLRARTQSSARTWSGGDNVGGVVAKQWAIDISFAQMRDPDLQEIKAFFSGLDGRANVLRMPDVARLAPWRDRNATLTETSFSDNSLFTDGSGFAAGYLPPEVYLAQAASRGDNYIVLGGFPASVPVLTKGDLLQVKPEGVPGLVPHLYQVQLAGASNSDGQVGVEITPRLRADLGAGDQVGLRFASGLFRLTSDMEGEFEDTGSGIGTGGFTAVEALDLVP